MSQALAINIYCFSDAGQNRLLTEVLGPACERFFESGALTRFFFDRFDARGPHVFAILALADAEAEREVLAALGKELEAFLADLPELAGPDEEEILARHQACRGKALCALDRLESFALRNSWAVARHDAIDYPFRIFARLEREAFFWQVFSEQSLWAIRQLAARGGRASGAGLRWAASIDLGLRQGGIDGEAYWRYHLSTLLPNQAEALASSPAATAELLAPLVREPNRAAFDRVFAAAAAPDGKDPQALRLVEALAGEFAGRRPAEEGWAMLRELVHLSLKQLGLHLGFQIPLVVYAWRRWLPPAS